MVEKKQKHLDYSPPPTSICLLSTLRRNVLCKQKRVLPKLITVITTTGSIIHTIPASMCFKSEKVPEEREVFL